MWMRGLHEPPQHNNPPYHLINSKFQFTFKGAFHLTNTNFITTLCYVVVFWTGNQIHRTLRESRQRMSSSTLSVQRQLTIILLLQVSRFHSLTLSSRCLRQFIHLRSLRFPSSWLQDFRFFI